jgi:DNA-binding transcriptional ArsR family regulator
MITYQSLNLNSVAENFQISRPAISKHIKILSECGLIIIKQKGRERFCESKLQKLYEVSDWIEPYRVFWASKLDTVDNYLNRKNPLTNKVKRIKKSKRK